jgi:hypothetical protein
LNSTIEKYALYKKHLIGLFPTDVLLSNALFAGETKLKQIDFFYRKALQLQFILAESLLHLIPDNTDDVYSDTEHINDFTLTQPKELFKSMEEFTSVTIGKTNGDLMYDLLTYAECVYYFSFTITKIFDDIPGLKKFCPTGIRNVRNHLIEHPKEKYTSRFEISIGNGTILRTEKYVYSEELKTHTYEKTLIDEGLENNIRQFKNELENILTLRLNGK